MRSLFCLFVVVIGAALLAACAPAPSPAPTSSPGASRLPASQPASASAPTPGSSVPPVSPSPHRPASASLPVHGHALELGEGVRMAPGPNGTLFVAIPGPGGSVLTHIDRDGRPTPGWPIEINDATSCGLLLPVADGSVRVVCTLENPGNLFDPIAAFAFDSTGGPLAGWPVDLADFYLAGRMVGDDLVLAMTWSLGDVIAEGQPSTEGGLVVVAADGTLTNGVRLPDPWACCADGDGPVIGPDGVAYFVGRERSADAGFDEVNRITALDRSGVRAGWPISFDGTGSRPAFGPDGQIVVTVSSYVRGTTRVLMFDPDGTASSSAELFLQTSSYAETGGCQPSQPQPPVVDANARIFVWSEMDDRILALDPSLRCKGRLAVPDRHDTCPSRQSIRQGGRVLPGADRADRRPRRDAVPVAPGPEIRPAGGSLVAVDPVGRERAGWPVGLRRAGSEFWSVAVGTDGTVYALAVELESSRTSSASVLAIAPDSSVLYTTTIIDP